MYDLDVMDLEDRQELAGWLLRNARHFYVRVLARQLLTMLRVAPGALPDMTHQSAEQWIVGTMLMRSLLRDSDTPHD